MYLSDTLKFNLIIYILLLWARQLSFAQGGFSKNYFLNNVITSQCLDAFEAPNGNIITVGLGTNGIFNVLKIIGTDANGNKLWEKNYGNSKFMYLLELLDSRAGIIDSDAFYLYRHVKDSSNNQLGVFIKFNYNGDTLWQKKYYENNKFITLQAATKSIDGGFILSGVCYNSNTYHAIINIKTDANGNEQWRKFYSKPVAPYFIEPKKIIQDSLTKRIYVIGNQFIYDGHPNQGYSNYGTIFLFDSLCNFIASKAFGGGCGSTFIDGLQTKDKHFIAIGDKDQCNDLGSRRNKSYLVKFGANNLNTIFTKEYDTLSIYNQFSSIQEYSNGDLLISGHYDTLNNYNLISKYGLRLIKTDKNGYLKKRRYYSYDTASANSKFTKSLNLLSNKGAIISYWLFQKPGGMPFSFTVVDSTLCDSTQAFCNSIGVGFNNQQYNRSEINIFPQPAQQLLNLNSSLFGNKKSQLTLNNILGQTVLNTSAQFTNGITQINLATLPKGVYLLKLVDEDNKTYTTKIIKE